jgi:PAS domain S-box-containing protein
MQRHPASRSLVRKGRNLRGMLSRDSKRATVLDRVLPKKFSSRLFLMAFIAGLIPIVVFTILIDTYGKRIEHEFNRIVDLGYSQDTNRSVIMLQSMGEASIRNRAYEIAQQLDLIIDTVPWMALSDLRRDEKFRDLAVQDISRNGYTFLFDADTGIIYFHRDRLFEGKDLRRAMSGQPDFQAILEASLKGPMAAHGYYRSKDASDSVTKKFVTIVPLHSSTADHTRLMLAATVNVEDFSAPIREVETIHAATRNYLTYASNQAIRTFRRQGLLFMGIGIVTVSLLAFVMGVFSSRAVGRLRGAMKRIDKGDYSTPVEVSGSGEVATLVRDFNRMVDRLSSTTVSKQLLQASEARLKAVNSDLRREISERERTESALAEEKERLSVTLRSIGDGVITADGEGRIVLMNNAAERLTGWEHEEATGLDLALVFHTVGEPAYEPSADGDGPTQGATSEMKNPLSQAVLQARDGTERIVAQTSSPIRDREGTTLGTVIVFRDITDQKRMEEEVLKARKLESIGVLAGGIAHDFNNLLAVVLGNISFAKMFMGPDDKLVNRLVEAENACMRGKDLTYQLLAFARGGGPVRKATDLAALVREAAVAAVTEPKLSLSFSFPDDLFPLAVDEKQIRQVIEKMVSNAQEAMAEGGTLWIGAENVEIGPASLLTLRQGDYVRISIRDEGPGIAEEDLQRVFDPYFTKKQMGNEKGTGLGLSICYSIIKDHGGLITVDSEAGKGTLFHIYLPSAQEEAATYFPEEQLPSQAGAHAGKGKLLFMDDDDGVRDVIVEILAHLGYEVLFARDGVEAIRHYEEAAMSGRPFDVVIADLTVRDGMGGKELIKQLHGIDPQVRAIISSGYSNDPVLSDFRRHGFLGVVAKPYRVEELCAVLDAVIEGEVA